jgi:hypothetical protein
MIPSDLYVGTEALTEIRGHRSQLDWIQMKHDPTFFWSNRIGLSNVGPGSIVPNLWNRT